MAGISLPVVNELRGNITLDTLHKAYISLFDYTARLRKELEFILMNLDSENVSELDANVTKIKNLVAETIITQTLVTQTLYAEKGYIAELTVDQLDTSAKVHKYKLRYDTDFDSNTEKQAESLSPVNYIKVYEQNIEFITGTVKYDEDENPLIEQAVDRFGNLLYWADAERKAVQYEANDDPVMIYQYDELTKMILTFKPDFSTGNYEVEITLGAGVGNETYPDRGKAFIQKVTDGLIFKYITPSGIERKISLLDDAMKGIENVDDQNTSTGVGQLKFWTGTAAEYAALTPSDDTLYFIKS